MIIRSCLNPPSAGCGGAGDPGDQLREEAAGAALRQRHPLAPGGEPGHHEVGELVLPLAPDRVPEDGLLSTPSLSLL